VRRALFALLLSACGSNSETQPAAVYRVAYRLEGALIGDRAIEADDDTALQSVENADKWGGPRIGCSVVNVTDADPTKGQNFVLSAVENYGDEHGAGLYFKVQSFHGLGTYQLDQGPSGRAWVFDRSHVQACVREDDTSCFQGFDGCSITIREWDFRPGAVDRPAGYPTRVAFGRASGSFSCTRLINAKLATSVSVLHGTFHCRAQDWSGR
jgi:hypothetical protein